MRTQKHFLIEKGEVEELVTFKHYTQLQDYIFDIDGDPVFSDKKIFTQQEQTKFKSQNSLRKFDTIDMIIMDVHASVLPWMKKGHDLTMLFRLCKASNKPVLGFQSAMAQLVFFCATQSKQFQVINGMERGGSLKLLPSLF
jgi:hypothetical protein